ncbi:AdoMet_MTases domain containing protein [uncultured Caudovirales phage]|uniref:AdoMet_MTases domain containing protein n=1 Tax=uncultured Caudovirales phage TaxID=2100421 RepID=A0A6J5L7A5_9CAUD|nr:AdoMet_MTases domain containing protein [uncultured Caudovirales phage]
MTNNTITTTEEEFNWFSNNGVFMPMINDTGRNVFYKAAIERAVKDKVVCDIGTGTGFLSVLSAKAGAKKVYAVEMDPGRADFAKRMIHSVGLSDVVEVINENFLDTEISADIYVSETIGTQVFNENIIAIAEHARKNGGVFIPSTFELTVKIFKNHPIFPIVQTGSDAFEFQPDIEIDDKFESLINAGFQQRHSLGNTLYRANCIHNLFKELPKFDDLRLTLQYETDPIIVDLNQPVNMEDIKIVVPADKVDMNDVGVCAVLFWRAKYQDLTMDVTDTIWGNPSKIIMDRVRDATKPITMWYDHSIADWRLTF